MDEFFDLDESHLHMVHTCGEKLRSDLALLSVEGGPSIVKVGVAIGRHVAAGNSVSTGIKDTRVSDLAVVVTAKYDNAIVVQRNQPYGGGVSIYRKFATNPDPEHEQMEFLGTYRLEVGDGVLIGTTRIHARGDDSQALTVLYRIEQYVVNGTGTRFCLLRDGVHPVLFYGEREAWDALQQAHAQSSSQYNGHPSSTQLQQQLFDLQAQFATLQGQLDQAKRTSASVPGLQQQVATLQHQLDQEKDTSASIPGLQQQVATLQGQLDQEKQQAATLKRRLDQVKLISASVPELRQQVASLGITIGKLDQRITELQNQPDGAADIHATKCKVLESRNKELSKAKFALEEQLAEILKQKENGKQLPVGSDEEIQQDQLNASTRGAPAGDVVNGSNSEMDVDVELDRGARGKSNDKKNSIDRGGGGKVVAGSVGDVAAQHTLDSNVNGRSEDEEPSRDEVGKEKDDADDKTSESDFPMHNDGHSDDEEESRDKYNKEKDHADDRTNELDFDMHDDGHSDDEDDANMDAENPVGDDGSRDKVSNETQQQAEALLSKLTSCEGIEEVTLGNLDQKSHLLYSRADDPEQFREMRLCSHQSAASIGQNMIDVFMFEEMEGVNGSVAYAFNKRSISLDEFKVVKIDPKLVQVEDSTASKPPLGKVFDLSADDHATKGKVTKYLVSRPSFVFFELDDGDRVWVEWAPLDAGKHDETNVPQTQKESVSEDLVVSPSTQQPSPAINRNKDQCASYPNGCSPHMSQCMTEGALIADKAKHPCAGGCGRSLHGFPCCYNGVMGMVGMKCYYCTPPNERQFPPLPAGIRDCECNLCTLPEPVQASYVGPSPSVTLPEPVQASYVGPSPSASVWALSFEDVGKEKAFGASDYLFDGQVDRGRKIFFDSTITILASYISNNVSVTNHVKWDVAKIGVEAVIKNGGFFVKKQGDGKYIVVDPIKDSKCFECLMEDVHTCRISLGRNSLARYMIMPIPAEVTEKDYWYSTPHDKIHPGNIRFKEICKDYVVNGAPAGISRIQHIVTCFKKEQGARFLRKSTRPPFDVREMIDQEIYWKISAAVDNAKKELLAFPSQSTARSDDHQVGSKRKSSDKSSRSTRICVRQVE